MLEAAGLQPEPPERFRSEAGRDRFDNRVSLREHYSDVRQRRIRKGDNNVEEL